MLETLWENIYLYIMESMNRRPIKHIRDLYTWLRASFTHQKFISLTTSKISCLPSIVPSLWPPAESKPLFCFAQTICHTTLNHDSPFFELLQGLLNVLTLNPKTRKASEMEPLFISTVSSIAPLHLTFLWPSSVPQTHYIGFCRKTTAYTIFSAWIHPLMALHKADLSSFKSFFKCRLFLESYLSMFCKQLPLCSFLSLSLGLVKN